MASHDCPINHSGSASSMEQAGVVSCFKRSISDYKVRYTYIGDGDSSSFSSLCKADPYGGNYKSKYLMKKGIWAILWHCSEDDKDTPGTRHQFCLRGDDTWSSYWKVLNSGSLETYKEKVGLPDAIKKILKPIFVDLTKDELLLKCVHGLTRNNNESINNVIWKRVPKDIYVGREVLEMGVASAVINYNQGLNGICNVYNELSMEVGKFTESFLKQFDTKRVNQMNKKSSDTGKLRRKKLRANSIWLALYPQYLYSILFLTDFVYLCYFTCLNMIFRKATFLSSSVENNLAAYSVWSHFYMVSLIV